MAASNRVAWAVSADGKRVATSFASVSATERRARSVCLAKATSIVPRIGAFAPFGVMPMATRALSACRSGHEITCGW